MLAGSGAPRRVRLGGERRMPISGTLFTLEDGLIGMVLDAGAHEALAQLAEEQSALRRVATLVASSPEPEAVFQAVAEEAGRLLHVRSAATIRYEGDQALDRRALGRRARPGRVHRRHLGPADRQRRADRDRRPHRRARADRGLPRRARARGRADARARLPLGGRGAVVVAGGRIWGLVLVASWARSARRREPAGGLRRAGRARARERRGARGAQRVARADPRRGRATSAAGWSATSTTAPSSGSSRSPCSCGCSRRSSASPRRPRALLHGAADELEQALAELRELARGLHPAVLADRGLAPALETLASRSPLPLSVEGVPEERLAEPVEAAVYFVVAESLTNAVKHARRVRVARADGAATASCRSRSPTTGAAAPTPARATAPGCAGSPIASRRSAGSWRSTRRPARARPCAPCCRSK